MNFLKLPEFGDIIAIYMWRFLPLRLNVRFFGDSLTISFTFRLTRNLYSFPFSEHGEHSWSVVKPLFPFRRRLVYLAGAHALAHARMYARPHACMAHAGTHARTRVSRRYYLKITSDERRQQVVEMSRGNHNRVAPCGD